MIIDGIEYLTTKEAMKLLTYKSYTTFRKFFLNHPHTITRINLTHPGKEGPGMKYHFVESEILAAVKESNILY